MKLTVKVVPGASRTEITGWLGDALKVRVSAPPERGKANAAVEETISRALSLPTGAVRVVSGGKSSHKILEIEGLSEPEVLQLLCRPPG